MYLEKTVEAKEKVGVTESSAEAYPKISDLMLSFVKYCEVEMSFSPNTLSKYSECLKTTITLIGDLPVNEITVIQVTELKQKVLARGAHEARLSSIVFALKSFLRFCREYFELDVLDPKRIRSPRRLRREVLFLSPEEIKQFVDSIRITRKYNGKHYEEGYRLDGLRFRTLVEVLLGTGMRISEALSLNRDSIDFEKREAKIIGKGNKERIVFFTERSLEWVKIYLEERKDEHESLFVTNLRTRLSKGDVSSLFKRNLSKSGLNKKVTPHILRHTTATTLLFNGCPISHVKEILGHDRLETTCKYYLGVDKAKAKEAHRAFLMLT